MHSFNRECIFSGIMEILFYTRYGIFNQSVPDLYPLWYIIKACSLYQKGDIDDQNRRLYKSRKKASGNDTERICHQIRIRTSVCTGLEQGKETVRLDKVNQALAMFDMEAVPGRIKKKDE